VVKVLEPGPARNTKPRLSGQPPQESPLKPFTANETARGRHEHERRLVIASRPTLLPWRLLRQGLSLKIETMPRRRLARPRSLPAAKCLVREELVRLEIFIEFITQSYGV
jgi:hypothetical protein